MKTYEVSLVDEYGVPQDAGIMPVSADNAISAAEEYLVLFANTNHVMSGIRVAVRLQNSNLAICFDIGVIGY